jgi:hypothetical protein
MSFSSTHWSSTPPSNCTKYSLLSRWSEEEEEKDEKEWRESSREEGTEEGQNRERERETGRQGREEKKVWSDQIQSRYGWNSSKKGDGKDEKDDEESMLWGKQPTRIKSRSCHVMSFLFSPPWFNPLLFFHVLRLLALLGIWLELYTILNLSSVENPQGSELLVNLLWEKTGYLKKGRRGFREKWV